MQSSVEDAIDRMVQAWNAGDAAAYARQFTQDATYVIFAGAVSLGREAIRRDHEPVLTKFRKGSRMRVVITRIRYLSDDTAHVLTEGGVGKRPRIPLDKVQTFLFRRQPDGSWLCDAFQNTKKNRLMIWLAGRGTQGKNSPGPPATFPSTPVDRERGGQ
jgi:uncharacterized protein (TIGR02246 family)